MEIPEKRSWGVGGLIGCVLLAIVAWLMAWTVGGLGQTVSEWRRPPYARTAALVKTVHIKVVGNRHTSWKPELACEFTLDGHTCPVSAVGEHWCWSPHLDDDQAKTFKAEFAEGKAIPVMYDPSDPSRCYAVLPDKYRSVTNLIGLLAFAGGAVLMTLVSFVGTVSWWRSKRRK